MARLSTLDLDKVFPHWCKIYSYGEPDPFSEEEENITIFYEGRCRDEGNAAMRTYQTDGVLKADHALQIPSLVVGVTNDARIDIKNDCGEITDRQLTSCQPFRYGERNGTTIFYNEAKN